MQFYLSNNILYLKMRFTKYYRENIFHDLEVIIKKNDD